MLSNRAQVVPNDPKINNQLPGAPDFDFETWESANAFEPGTTSVVPKDPKINPGFSPC